MSAWQLDETYNFRGGTIRHGSLGAGAPIVLVHGTPFSSYVWHRVAPYLAERYRVYYFDLLGYGRSDKPDRQDVSLGVQNVLLGELLDHWGLDRPHVVGHDFGGTTALRTHLLDGRDFQTLTLIDPVAIAPWGIGLDRHVRGHEQAFRGLPPDIHEAILTTYLRGAINRQLPQEELVPYLEPWLNEAGQAAFYRQIAQFDQRLTDEIEPRYSEIRCPTLILWGEQDRWLPIEHGRRLASLIPHAHFKPIAGAGHLVHEDAPEALVAAILTFLGAEQPALSPTADRLPEARWTQPRRPRPLADPDVSAGGLDHVDAAPTERSGHSHRVPRALLLSRRSGFGRPGFRFWARCNGSGSQTTGGAAGHTPDGSGSGRLVFD